MNFFKRKLGNGITVILEKRVLPVVSASISNRFGAAYEDSNIKGIAHFIEHLVFTGTKSRTHEDITKEIEKKGGMLNAFTANEVTSFLFKLPSEHLFVGFDIMTDLLLNPVFEKDKFEKEKKVILEEIKMYHDSPERAVFDMIVEQLYEKPFGEPITGSSEIILGMDRELVINYFKEMYSPENYIVTIVGNADFDKVCKYFEEKFIGGKRNKDIKEIKIRRGEMIEEREGIDQAHTLIGMHAPLPQNQEYYALEVLDAYLASGMSSKLFLKIREEKGLAYTVSSTMNAEKNYSYYAIYCGTTKQAVEEVKKIIIEEFLSIDSMTEKDLEDAKERVIGLKEISSEESLKVMNELLFTELCSQAEDYYLKAEKIRSVTLEQVKKLSKEMIQNYSFVAVIPK